MVCCCFYTCKPSTRDNHEAQQKWWNCSLGKKTFVAPTNIGFRYGWKSKTCWHVNIYQPQLPREINCHLFKWCNPGGPSHTWGFLCTGTAGARLRAPSFATLWEPASWATILQWVVDAWVVFIDVTVLVVLHDLVTRLTYYSPASQRSERDEGLEENAAAAAGGRTGKKREEEDGTLFKSIEPLQRWAKNLHCNPCWWDAAATELQKASAAASSLRLPGHSLTQPGCAPHQWEAAWPHPT